MKELPCWAIMNCESRTCVTREQDDQACWEIVQGLEDYRAEFNICPDCLVYVLKTESLAFSPHDLSQLASERRCPLSP